ncbi:hypothetical protein D9M70_607120 [compost metagenome]
MQFAEGVLHQLVAGFQAAHLGRPNHFIHPLQQLLTICRRQRDHVHEDADWQAAREFRDELALATGAKSLDQFDG